jgi:hypothetical protein
MNIDALHGKMVSTKKLQGGSNMFIETNYTTAKALRI